jgi:hypothetical protein
MAAGNGESADSEIISISISLSAASESVSGEKRLQSEKPVVAYATAAPKCSAAWRSSAMASMAWRMAAVAGGGENVAG